jgi:zinc/manganese transport system permease protein
MTEFLRSMAWPFAACLLLAGILVYLGIHVISRKVIFVDLALAQIAALGSVWGVLLGWDLQNDPWIVKAFALAFTFLGAAVFTSTRMRDERVPHEALIGITYAVALGATILASSHLAHGAEEVSELMAGSILWVRAPDILATAPVFAAVGAFHWIFRRQFFLVSLDPARAEAEGMSLRLWDFLFYVSLGFAVTSAVSIAGVLLVFSYLVIPAVVALLFAGRIGHRLAVGWAVGTIVSAIGCWISYSGNLPSGPTIVATFGTFLVLAGVVHFVLRSSSRPAASLRVAAGAAFLAVFFGGSLMLQKREHHDSYHVLETGSKAEKMLALAEIDADPALWSRIGSVAGAIFSGPENEVRIRLLDLIESHRDTALLPAVEALLVDPDDTVRERALRCVKALGNRKSGDAILAASAREEDEYIKVEMAEALLELDDPRGFGPMIDVLEGGGAEQARRDAWEHLRAHAEFPQGVAVADVRRWWHANRDRLVLVRPGFFGPKS